MKEMPPFASVVSCLPLTISVVPKQGSDRFEYSVRVEGEDTFLAVLRYNIGLETLTLSLAEALEIQDIVRVIVTLPAGALSSVEAHDSMGTVFVGRGFDVTELEAKCFDSKLVVSGIYAEEVSASVTQNGFLYVGGVIQNAFLGAKGVSNLVVKGVRQNAKVEVTDAAKVYLMGSESMSVTGHAQMIGKVFVDKDQSCELTDGSYFYPSPVACMVLNPADVPHVTVQWTSTLQTTGSSSCYSALDKESSQTIQTYHFLNRDKGSKIT